MAACDPSRGSRGRPGPRSCGGGEGASADCPAEHFVGWARSHAGAIRAEAAPDDFDDLAPFRSIVAHARVVGFGESQHHVREFARTRARLFRFLVAEMGFTTFVFESGVVESKPAHDYVLGLHQDADAAFVPIESGFSLWREFQELVHWMRDYNRDAGDARRIKFYGMDGSRRWMSTSNAVAFVCDYLDRVSPHRAGEARATLLPLARSISLYNAGQTSTEAVRALVHGIVDLVGHLQIEQMRYIQATGFEEFDWALRAALVARQIGTILSAAHADPGNAQRYRWAIRDAGMATHIQWILRREGPQARLVVGAHNVHLQKDFASGALATVGQHLSLGLPADQVVMIAGTSDYSLKPEDQAVEGSLQWALARVGLPSFVVDLRALRDDEQAARWLERERLDRVNVGYQSLDVTRAWDAVYFSRRIAVDTLSLPRPFARRYVDIAGERLEGLEGIYDVAGIGDNPVVLRVHREGDRLLTSGLESDGELFPMGRSRLLALSDSRFAWPEWAWEVEFERGADGTAVGLDLRAPRAVDSFHGTKRA